METKVQASVVEVPLVGVGPVEVLAGAALFRADCVSPAWDGDGRWLFSLRVSVEVDGASLPMRVVAPTVCVQAPIRVGRLVVFDGLRVQFTTRNGRCRPVVRADGVREVTTDVRAA